MSTPETKSSKASINIRTILGNIFNPFFNGIYRLFTYDNQKASKVLLVIAILIELAVATLGIYLGILLMKEGRTGLAELTLNQSEIELSTLQNNFIILIYSIIALVELARVPLIISIYRGNSAIWKVLGSLIVAILMLVAFISMSIGQIKISSLRDTNIQIIDTKIGIEQDSLELANAELFDLESLTKESIDTAYQLEIQNINENEDKQLSQLRERRDQIEIQKTRSSEIERDELKDLEEQLSKLENDEQNEIRISTQDIELKIKSLTERHDKEIENLNINISSEKARREKNQGLIADASVWTGEARITREEIEDSNEKINQYETQISELEGTFKSEIQLLEEERDEEIIKIRNNYDSEIADLEKIIDQKKSDIGVIRRQSSEELDVRISQIDEEIKIIQNQNQSDREFAREAYDGRLVEYDKKQSQIEGKKLEIIEIKEEINNLKAEKETKTNSKLVYLLATHFSFLDACEGAETAGDVTPECRKITENIWFGMIAGIVAIAGSAVAIGSEILRTADSRVRSKRKPIRNILVKIFRYAFRPRIKYVDKEVEKIVEVPKIVTEEKIVIKEVPKEIIKKEIVHVPVPTIREILHEDGLIHKVVKDPKKDE